ncbi:MAG: hypothetical protein KJ645_12215 [Planctomycetes bacterium]|nr:hypothetical protein [Planctomycetota bacterium]
MNRSMTASIVIIILMALMSGCCCPWICEPKAWVNEETTKLLPASNIESFDVSTYNGSIVVQAASGVDEINVKIKMKAGGKNSLDADRCMEALIIFDEVEGTTQKLGWKWRDPDEARRNHWQSQVSFEIRLPPSLKIMAETYNGDVSLSGMESEAKLKAYNGSLKAGRHLGDLIMETYNGTIRASACAPKIFMESYNGSIKADLEGDLLDGSIKTYNGSISLAIIDRPSTRFICRTCNGGIDAGQEMSIAKRGKHFLEAVMGEGRDTVDIESYNGSISVQ